MNLGDEPAFPVENDADKEYNYIKKGMTLRQHYAGLAMQGMVASDPDGQFSPEAIAKNAVSITDALIAELERKPTT